MLNQNPATTRSAATVGNDPAPARRQTRQPPADWQSQLADAVRDLGQLRQLAGLAAEASPPCKYTFGPLVPRAFIDRVRKGDSRDPLLVQVMPTAAENERCEGFVADPLGEAVARPGQASTSPCLLHKYRGRSLIVTTAACGVHCRYCFRRHTTHKGGCGDGFTSGRVESAMERIAADVSIREAILSGGDPLTIDDARLAELVERLGRIGHLSRLRIHTRMPIVIPQRVTRGLVELLGSSRPRAIVVVQANHPNELSGGVENALAELIDAGVPVLCQSVLLAGVNDNLEALAGLYERLVDMRVMPYYLHQLDRVAGAAHFEVPESRGRELIAGLRELLPGYAVPRYVREIRGATYKRSLA
jgi:L-lysine 2,3-aminomutase